jgi:hypothetical protein
LNSSQTHPYQCFASICSTILNSDLKPRSSPDLTARVIIYFPCLVSFQEFTSTEFPSVSHYACPFCEITFAQSRVLTVSSGSSVTATGGPRPCLSKGDRAAVISHKQRLPGGTEPESFQQRRCCQRSIDMAIRAADAESEGSKAIYESQSCQPGIASAATSHEWLGCCAPKRQSRPNSLCIDRSRRYAVLHSPHHAPTALRIALTSVLRQQRQRRAAPSPSGESKLSRLETRHCRGQ